MIFIRPILACVIGIAMLANLRTAHAQSEAAQKECQAYFCMLTAQAAQDTSCQPLIDQVFDIFPQGSHTVTCGSDSTDIPALSVIHRQADKDFCRPDLLEKDVCSAQTVIDFSFQGVLYTRQWKLKVGTPITEYYEGTSSPGYTPSPTPPTPPEPNRGVIPRGPQLT